MLDQKALRAEDQTTTAETVPAEKAVRNRARRKWRRWAKLGILIIVCFVVLNHSLILFRVIRLKNSDPTITAMMEYRQEEAIARGAAPKHEQTWVPYNHVSPAILRAIIAGEDPTFWQHSGFNWELIQAAIEENLKKKRFARGASTISQQLAKNLFLSPSKNPIRKLHEAVIAFEMEKILGKRRILELYLNVIEFGDGIYGVEAAAQHYFKTSAASLSDQQAALLTAIIPMPRGDYDLGNPPDRVRERSRSVFEHMRGITLPD